MAAVALRLKAAASGFVVILLSVTVMKGQSDWEVMYNSTKICAFKGFTVEIHCTYKHPSTIKTVENKFWFTKKRENEDLRTDPEYAGRVEYICNNRGCTLRIKDLRESDSAVYKFRFITDQSAGRYTGEPGVMLSITDPDLELQVKRSAPLALSCVSSCTIADHSSCIWYNNGEKIKMSSCTIITNDTGNYSCSVQGQEDYRSPAVYAPKPPSVSVCPSGEIQEGSSVTLTCSSDANPACKHTWHKKNPDVQSLSKEPLYVFNSIHSSDSGEYYCTAENKLGTTTKSVFIDVKYAPKPPSVSVSHSAEIVEGSSVNLTCSSDANPAANYTWYKENQTLLQGPDGIYPFSKISSEDRGTYYCKSENKYGQTNSTSLFVDVQYAPKPPSVSVSPSAEIVEGSSVNLTCSSDANPAANYTWYKENQTLLQGPDGIYPFSKISSEDRGTYYCKSENKYGQTNSTSLFVDVQYAPKPPSVSVSPSAEIVEGSSVNLTCSSDANPAANYTWYKENQTLLQGPDGIYPFSKISSEDRGTYYCKSENKYGQTNSTSLFVDVQYAPKPPSVSVSPSAEIVEGSSVNLTCSSDANPAANYTWYKENQTLLQGPDGIYPFSEISSEDRGTYYCMSENKYGQTNSTSLFVDVQYAPKPPSVSVSPSAEIVEGSSVNLTCSSDANPAANYTWYKENDDSPKASGQIFTIAASRPEHSGNYYCEAQNSRGRHNSTLHLNVVVGAWKLTAAVSVPAISLAVILTSVFLWIIKKRASKQQPGAAETPDSGEQIQPAEQQDDCHYASVHFSENQEDPIYSNFRPSQPQRHRTQKKEEEEMVEYAAVTFHSTRTSWRSKGQDAAEDPSALYSRINKPRKER